MANFDCKILTLSFSNCEIVLIGCGFSSSKTKINRCAVAVLLLLLVMLLLLLVVLYLVKSNMGAI